MFRHLKNFYFLSLKSFRVNSAHQKSSDLSRINVESSASREKIIGLLLKQTNSKDWDKITRDIQSFIHVPNSNPDLKVLQYCEENQLSRQAMSFLHYLLKKNRLSEQFLTKFLALTSKDPKSYEPSQRLIYMLFTKYLDTYPNIAQKCTLTLFQYPAQFDEVFKIYMENLDKFTDHEIAIRCLMSCNRIEEALELYLRTHCNVHFQVFLLEFIENELKNSRMPNKITEVVERIMENLVCQKKFFQYSSEFSNVLHLINKIDKNYSWNMVSFPSTYTKCNSCGDKLEQSSVTEEEMEFLLDGFMKEIVFKNVFILTFQQNWNNFLQFLDTVDYDTVVDGLNVYYSFQGNINRMETVMNKIAAKRKKLLIITKLHNKKNISSSGLHATCSVFYTCNEEQDDIYILYAAFRQGVGCWVFTHDKYGFCKHQISSKLIDIYERWEDSHIGKVIGRSNRLIWPVGLKSGFEKKSCSDPSELKYHAIMNSIENYPLVSCITKRRRNY